MLIHAENRFSRLDICLKSAPKFLLTEKEARLIIDRQIEVIHANWDLVCEEAELSEIDKKFFWKRQFLNPYATLFY